MLEMPCLRAGAAFHFQLSTNIYDSLLLPSTCPTVGKKGANQRSLWSDINSLEMARTGQYQDPMKQ